MNRNKITVILLFVLLISLAYFTQKIWRSNSMTNEVRLGYLPITADVSLFVSLEKDLFKSHNIEIIPVRFTSSNQAMNALIAGKIDGAIMIGYSTLITVFSKDNSLFKVIQSAIETENKFTSRIIVPKDSPIRYISELDGRSIGTYSGLTQRLNLILILNNFFDNPEDKLNIIQVESNLQISSLASGRFDALFTIDPHATVALEKGIGRSISDSPRAKYIVNPFPTAATIFSQSFINNRKEIASKVLSILTRASMWADENPNEAAKILSKEEYTNIPLEIALKVGTYGWWYSGEEEVGAIQSLADIMFENDLLKSRISVKAMLLESNQLIPQGVE